MLKKEKKAAFLTNLFQTWDSMSNMVTEEIGILIPADCNISTTSLVLVLLPAESLVSTMLRNQGENGSVFHKDALTYDIEKQLNLQIVKIPLI